MSFESDGLLNLLITWMSSGFRLLSLIVEDLGDLNTITPFIGRVIDGLKPLALSMVVLYFFVEAIEKALEQSWEQGTALSTAVRVIIKCVIGYVFIDAVPTIITYILSAGISFIGEASVWADEIPANYPAPTITAFGAGFFVTLIFYLLPALISLVVQLLVCVVLAIQVLTILIELGLRLSFLPIGLAALIPEGTRGSGMRYLKKCIACALYLGGIQLMIRLVHLVTQVGASSYTPDVISAPNEWGSALLGFLWTIIFQGLVGPFIVLSCVNVVKSVINEAFGT